MPNCEQDSDYPQGQELPAVRTTIVGGRPPGSGMALGAIPCGIEVLVKKASVDAAFRAVLMAKRSVAAGEIGLILEPAEAMMLDIIPAEQLDAIIARTKVEPAKKPAFLGKAAAVMLVALGAAAIKTVSLGQDVAGIRKLPAPTSAPAPEPTTQPATTQASQPASQPASYPAVTREQIMPILKQLDSEEYRERVAGQKKLEALGPGALQPLREILKTEKLSTEVDNRIKNAMWQIKTTTRPSLLGPAEPQQLPVAIAGQMVRPTPTAAPEKPED